MRIKCDNCRVREAKFFRRASGDRLCESCLESSLEKALRKYLRNWGVLRPNSTIVVPVSPPFLIQSLALAKMIVKSKRGYGSRVYVTLLDYSGQSSWVRSVRSLLLEAIRGGRGWLLAHATTVASFDSSALDVFESIRALRALTADLAKRLGASFALLSIPRTSILILLGEAIAKKSCDSILDLSPEHRIGDVLVINALHEVEDEAVIAYAYLHGLLQDYLLIDPYGSRKLVLSKAMSESLRSGPDLQFSSTHVRDKMIEACMKYMRYTTSCSSCGAPSMASKCDLCKRYSFKINQVEVTDSMLEESQL